MATPTTTKVAPSTANLGKGSAVYEAIAALNNFFYGEATIDPASIAAGAEAEVTATLTPPTGVTFAAGDLVFVMTAPGLEAGIYVRRARISAANTLALVFRNETAAAVDPVSGVYTYLIIKKDTLQLRGVGTPY